MFKVEIKDSEANAALAGLQTHLSDLSPVMKEIGESLLFSTEKRFDHTEAPDGTQWAPRSPVTLARYAKQGGSIGPILHRTGELRAFGYPSSDATSVTIGTNTLWAAAMQFGAVKGSLGAYWYTSKNGKTVEGSSPWGNIPPRPFIGISDSDRAGIEDTVVEWLARIAKG